MTSESQAAIVEALVEPYEPSSTLAQTRVQIVNIGQHLADYLITMTDCAPTVAPVPARWKTLEPAEFATLTFDVRSSVPFVGGETCTVKMLSPNAFHYDEEPVVLPAPTP